MSILYSLGRFAGRVVGVPTAVKIRARRITKKTREEFERGRAVTIRRIGEGKPPIKKTRKFGGQTFRLKSSHGKKSKADSVAKAFRKKTKGNQARVEKVQGRWRVYTRG